MSVLFYGMLLTSLGGVQAATAVDKRSSPEDSVSWLIIKMLQADILRGRLSGRQGEGAEEEEEERYRDAEPEGEHQRDGGTRSGDWQPAVWLDAEVLSREERYPSPRVLLSQRPPLQPPPLFRLEDSAQPANGTARRKRHAERRGHRGEYSVCDSESRWVTDKTAATDIRGRQVTVLGEIKTGSSAIKQYFYETRCREAKPVKNGCRGIDDKHWNSQCKTSQTYVRALSTENNKYVGWRWIRIDTSCLCALSRKLGKS